MKSYKTSLPQGWILTSLGDVANYVNGRGFKPTEWLENGKPIIRIQNLNNHTAKFNYSTIEHEEKYVVKNGDLLFAWSASLGAYIWHGQDAWLNQHIFRVDPYRCINKFFLYYLLTDITAGLYAKSHGSGMVHVTKGKFEATEFVLPPIQEQQRIVAKIEALFSELDKGIESFKTAREQLKIYRQALLKHAFSGKLTEQWRAENLDKLETAEALLQRIQTEREQRYQQQLNDWEANGKQGSKPKAPKTLPPLKAEELAELPDLPEGWVWVRIGELVDRVTVGHVGSMKEEYVENGIPFLRSQNVRENQFDSEGLKFVAKNFHDSLKKSELCPGDVVIIRSGSVGVSCVIPDNLGLANCSDLVIVKKPRYILSKLIAYYMNWQTQGRVKGKMVGVALIHFNTKSVEDFAIPLFDLKEQVILQSYIEERFSVIDQLNQTIITALQQAEALRQSILKKAFSGQLVPQDPNDEPVSVLLERIQAEKAQTNRQVTRQRVKN